MITTDVLIVGAGPTGMSAALALSKAGKKVMIVDKHENGLGFSRAIFLNPSTLEALKPFGVTDKIIQRGRPFKYFGIAGKNGPVISTAITPKDFKNQNIPINLVQLETERCLYETLEENNVLVQRSIQLQTFVQDENGVTAQLLNLKDGNVFEVRSNYLLGCDGYHSVTRKQLGIELVEEKASTKMIGVDAEMNWSQENDVLIWMLPEGMMISIRLDETKVRFGGMPVSMLEKIKSLTELKKIVWQQEFDIHFAYVKQYGKDRVWLAGDAAHVHSPVGGRGLNMGVADGLRLAKAVIEEQFELYQKTSYAINTKWVKANSRLTKLLSQNNFISRAGKRVILFVLKIASSVGLSSIIKMGFKKGTGA